MKIAITGATGFIGKVLVEKHVKLGDEVRILSRKDKLDFDFKSLEKIQIFKGDLSNKELLLNFVDNVDVLYHCAAEIRDESIMKFVNVEGTINLINASIGKIKHWVQLSSTGVYGPIYDGIVVESQEYNPINEYERTKLKSDLLVLEAALKNNFSYTLVRPSNVFGYQMTNQSLFQLIKMIDKGFYFFVGSKGSSANYVPVENVVEALYLAATNPKAKNETYIVSSWSTIEFFVENIAKILDKPSPKFRISVGFTKFVAKLTFFIPKNPLTVARVNALSTKVLYKTTKIENELSYKPVVTVEETIEKLVRFYKKDSLFK
ncbi:NAD-dependent epimerase/dehydratase family protein [Flavobacterium sp. FlaQc-48]|uniref:NAD-dependent epimerase/dehydratase family protein n=1 Tax=Flavobacterium sp. FlaQc-48 TaxID=3374181 RepID=UPI00375698F1